MSYICFDYSVDCRSYVDFPHVITIRVKFQSIEPQDTVRTVIDGHELHRTKMVEVIAWLDANLHARDWQYGFETYSKLRRIFVFAKKSDAMRLKMAML